MRHTYDHIDIPSSKRRTGAICHIADLTGINGDLDSDIHNGFTVGSGKVVYWSMIWHKSGHVTVFSKDTMARRWLSGDTEITIHFK